MSVAEVREFNRFYTNVIGVLDDGLERTPYSLTEARVIFELAQNESTDVVDLRRRLNLDPGYLSRILRRFEADGLVARSRSGTDARRQVVALTPSGRAAFDLLDGRSTQTVGRLLDTLAPAERTRLVDAMATIRRLLAPAEPSRDPEVRLRAPEPGDYGWVIGRHGTLYQQEYGWDLGFETLVARIVTDFAEHHDPEAERAWIAEVDGAPAGCVFCVRDADTPAGDVARLRLLLVDPAARGHGLGGRLVDACVEFARARGYRRIVLWTNDVLADARRIYQRAGFHLDREYRHHSYGHDLVGQDWSMDLA